MCQELGTSSVGCDNCFHCFTRYGDSNPVGTDDVILVVVNPDLCG